MGSQDKTALGHDELVFNDQVALLMRQAISDMQRRIKSTARLVVARLHHAAPVELSNEKHLTSSVSNPATRCKLQDVLSLAGSTDSPEDFAECFDEMLTHQCSKLLSC